MPVRESECNAQNAALHIATCRCSNTIEEQNTDHGPVLHSHSVPGCRHVTSSYACSPADTQSVVASSDAVLTDRHTASNRMHTGS